MGQPIGAFQEGETAKEMGAFVYVPPVVPLDLDLVSIIHFQRMYVPIPYEEP